MGYEAPKFNTTFVCEDLEFSVNTTRVPNRAERIWVRGRAYRVVNVTTYLTDPVAGVGERWKVDLELE